EYLASAPSQALILRFTADKPGACSGTLRFTDAHQAVSTIAGNILTASGKLANGLEYETQLQVLPAGGKVVPENQGFRIDRADALTIIVVAATNYAPDRARGWRSDHPHQRLTAQLRAAASRSYADLRNAHLTDYQRLFRRVSLNLGGDPELLSKPTD